ncbi:hypothetical protein D3C78_1038720 [compost metagenome]
MEKTSQAMYEAMSSPATIKLSTSVSFSVMEWVLKNIAGTNKAITATIIREPFIPARVTLKFCTLNFIPPAKILKPRTSSRLPIMEPVRLAFTMSNSPSFTRKKAMISSAALPKVAFRKPPNRCPA